MSIEEFKSELIDTINNTCVENKVPVKAFIHKIWKINTFDEKLSFTTPEELTTAPSISIGDIYLEYCKEHQNMNTIVQKILATFLWYCENDAYEDLSKQNLTNMQTYIDKISETGNLIPVLINTKANEKFARELLEYLKNTAGQQIITGQHTQTIPCEEIAYIRQTTGKEPKLRGFELLAYSPNINYADASPECLTEVEENKGTAETALQWARANRPDKVNDTGTENSTDYTTGGILTFSFHWFSPLGGRDKSFYTEHTDFDAAKILQEGTPERAAFYHDMDVIAGILQQFQQEHIPILWRPFHESYGTWFWWGAKGAKVARDLYRLMFDYYTGEKNLHNLLWVWNCDIEEAYPGDEYVDVVSIDVYLPEYQSTDYADAYEKLVAATSRDKVAALAEVGYLPDVELLQKSRIPWAYYMTWSKEFCIGEKYNRVENLKKMYDSEYAVTL